MRRPDCLAESGLERWQGLQVTNIVYIATSIDGYISAPDGALDWLEVVPNPQDEDLGFSEFVERVDAVVMGRVTFETAVGFDMGWPYPIPGIVLSATLNRVPEGFSEHVRIARGSPIEIVELARQQGFNDLYIDGGKTIQRFLREDLIDELIVTEIPVLLGGGARLFGSLDERMMFELAGTDVLLGQLVKRHYRRKRE